jgi:hypothetical protein
MYFVKSQLNRKLKLIQNERTSEMHLLLNIKSHGVYSFVYYYCIFVQQNIQTKNTMTVISRDDISQLVERLNLINFALVTNQLT